MIVMLPAFENGSSIPDQYAYCKIDPVNHVMPSDNKVPSVIWSDLPNGTKSLVLLCVDDKVPSVRTDANKEGVTLPKDMPRTDFYHWVLIDINPSLGAIKEGGDVNGGGIAGINSYGDGQGAYGGPCPPWNDALIHDYHFRLYALDIPSLGLSGQFTGPDVLKAMRGHILSKSEWTGTYTLNPSLRKNS